MLFNALEPFSALLTPLLSVDAPDASWLIGEARAGTVPLSLPSPAFKADAPFESALTPSWSFGTCELISFKPDVSLSFPLLSLLVPSISLSVPAAASFKPSLDSYIELKAVSAYSSEILCFNWLIIVVFIFSDILVAM